MSKEFIYDNFANLNNILKALEMGAFKGMEDVVLDVLARFTAIKNPNADYNLLQDGNSYDLETILAKKESFDEALINEIRKAFKGLIENYDKHIVNGKVPKKEYIDELIRVIRDNIEIACFITKKDENGIYEKELKKYHSIGMAYFSEKRIIASDAGTNKTTLHEINHMRTNFRESVPNFYNAIMTKVLAEGYSCCHQMFMEAPKISFRRNNVLGNNEKSVEATSYPFSMSEEYSYYKNIVDKIILLIGMDKFDSIRYKGENFIFNIRQEIAGKFGEANADRVVKAIVAVSNMVNPDGIKDLENADKKRSNYDNMMRDVTKNLEEKIRKMVAEIGKLNNQMNSPEFLKCEAKRYIKEKMEASQKRLESYESLKAPAVIIEKEKARQRETKNIDEEYIKRMIQVKIDEHKEKLCEIIAEYAKQIVNKDICDKNRSFNNEIEQLIRAQIGERDKSKYFLELENAMNECFCVMIDRVNTSAELVELYKLLKIYVAQGSFDVFDNKLVRDSNITKRNFKKQVYSQLIAKMKEKGLFPKYVENEDKNNLIHEAMFFSNLYNLNNSTIRISEKKKDIKILLEEKDGKSVDSIYVEVRNDGQIKYYSQELFDFCVSEGWVKWDLNNIKKMPKRHVLKSRPRGRRFLQDVYR